VNNLLWVSLGGAFGTGARYLVSVGMQRWLGSGFAWGTFSVNVLGSFLLALILTASPGAELSTQTRLLLGAGVMGGFTTYSTFSFETLAYIENGMVPLAIANVLATVIACLGACWLGVSLGRMTL
jgi:CrcB protein